MQGANDQWRKVNQTRPGRETSFRQFQVVEGRELLARTCQTLCYCHQVGEKKSLIYSSSWVNIVERNLTMFVRCSGDSSE